MKLGAFSISLSVKDIAVSRQFYETLGFEVFAGKEERKYFIMKNGSTLIGLFEGMFENNMLTFNPGWDSDVNVLEDFDDVRKIRKHLEGAGIPISGAAPEGESGPGSLTVFDPDGNAILIDQHV